MKRFIDRLEELSFLEKEYAASSSSLVILYGRRRTGKTSLLTEFIKGKPAVYFLATEESISENRNTFSTIVAEKFSNSILANAKMENWEPIFDVIVQNSREHKQIVIFDEFQYIGKSDPSFVSVMQKIWDNKLRNSNIMLILCGSLVNMMYQQALSYSSPLYGRRTGQIKLKQIGFEYYKEFFPSFGERDLIEYYSVTGGIPKYIEEFHEEGDIYTAIEKNVISKQSYMYEEPFFLLEKEVRDIGSYFSVIKTIASGRRKQNEISSALEIKATNLPKYLNVLIDLDIIEREVPVTESNPEKSKMGLYEIKDNFLEFWFRFIYPYRSYIESGYKDVVMKKIRSDFIKNHAAYVYERVCRDCYMWELAANGHLGFIPDKIGRWWDRKDTEIDIVAINTSGNDILFGECKYTTEPMDADVYYKLLEKAKKVSWNLGNRSERYILFSINGYTERLRNIADSNPKIILFST